MRYQLARIVLLLSAVAALCGCQAVGNRVSQDARHAEIRTGTPNTLTLADADGQWTANSVGPSGWTAMDADGVERFHQGSTPRELFYDPTSGRVVLSSGSDITAKGILIDPASGMVQVAEFSTSSSEPLRAQNEAFSALAGYWETLTQAQKDAHIADVEAAQAAGDTFAPVLLQLIRAAAGIP